jgi:integrase/recombinase XerD
MKLYEGVQQYIYRKQSSGMEFKPGQSCLFAFQRHAGDIEINDLRTEHVSAFLDAKVVSRGTRHTKHLIVHKFLGYWTARGAMGDFAMPPQRPPELRKFNPHIYTRGELRSLIRATLSNESPTRVVEKQTLRTHLLMLYATGAGISETLRLLNNDVDFKAKTISFRNRNGIRIRKIPLGSDLFDVLSQYCTWKTRRKLQCDHFLVTKDDHPLIARIVNENFRKLRRSANISPPNGPNRGQPRLDDLRFTFAVHRITSWIRNGADLNRMLPALAAYMGQIGLGATERYLALTPERFRKDLEKLSPTRNRKHWRNDKALMAFLANL